MGIYTELIKTIIIIIISIIIFWRIWFLISRKKIIKTYGKQKQKGGELKHEDGEHRVETEPSDNVGHDEPEGGQLLPTTNITNEGEGSKSSGRNNSLVEKFLRRTKNKK